MQMFHLQTMYLISDYHRSLQEGEGVGGGEGWGVKTHRAKISATINGFTHTSETDEQVFAKGTEVTAADNMGRHKYIREK